MKRDRVAQCSKTRSRIAIKVEIRNIKSGNSAGNALTGDEAVVMSGRVCVSACGCVDCLLAWESDIKRGIIQSDCYTELKNYDIVIHGPSWILQHTACSYYLSNIVTWITKEGKQGYGFSLEHKIGSLEFVSSSKFNHFCCIAWYFAQYLLHVKWKKKS